MTRARSWRAAFAGRLALAFAALLVLAPAAQAAPTVLWEHNLSPNTLSLSYPRSDVFDPIVATHPFDPLQLAVSFHWRPKKYAACGVAPGLRVSTDGGASWQTAAGRPWAGSGRYPNWHATIAWGPGPKPGTARLYWADTTVDDCTFKDHRLSVAYSDDLGATWSALYVYRGAAATDAGGYPDITVDRNPDSPNYGAVYAAINWFKTGTEPGYRVIASADFGKTWTDYEIAPLKAATGYPFRYRIGYRLRSAPDGALYATFCQRDRSSRSGSTGRLAYGIARLMLDARTGTLTGSQPLLATTVAVNGFNAGTRAAPGTTDKQALNTCWSHGLDVDGQGSIYMAVSNFRKKVPAGTPRGQVRFGRSTDRGASWTWRTLPPLPKIDGRLQSSYRPTLVVHHETVFVGLHFLADVPLDARAPHAAALAGNAYAVSTDGGAQFSVPALISASRWQLDWLDHARNGPGLRDRAELTTGGQVVYVYGDGRHGALRPSSYWGRGQVYGAMISLDAAGD